MNLNSLLEKGCADARPCLVPFEVKYFRFRQVNGATWVRVVGRKKGMIWNIEVEENDQAWLTSDNTNYMNKCATEATLTNNQ
ncbi:hypothetical protein GCM10023184_22400 [Flaviaesturariibacter amylovorans]|uniref:Uncharacterized protein n=1 Tax=Flaviaesturariibacter amylovorans TaxID=1084520 RepID=A0ABP8GWK9_9BACT